MRRLAWILLCWIAAASAIERDAVVEVGSGNSAPDLGERARGDSCSACVIQETAVSSRHPTGAKCVGKGGGAKSSRQAKAKGPKKSSGQKETKKRSGQVKATKAKPSGQAKAKGNNDWLTTPHCDACNFKVRIAKNKWSQPWRETKGHRKAQELALKKTTCEQHGGGGSCECQSPENIKRRKRAGTYYNYQSPRIPPNFSTMREADWCFPVTPFANEKNKPTLNRCLRCAKDPHLRTRRRRAFKPTKGSYKIKFGKPGGYTTKTNPCRDRPVQRRRRHVKLLRRRWPNLRRRRRVLRRRRCHGYSSYKNSRQATTAFPDKYGCVQCPFNKYPSEYLLGKSIPAKCRGAVICLAAIPRSARQRAVQGPRMRMTCNPKTVHDKANFSTQSCFSVGVPTTVLNIGLNLGKWKKKTNFVKWTVGCNLWKSIACITHKTGKKECASSKRVVFAYADNCDPLYGRTPDFYTGKLTYGDALKYKVILGGCGRNKSVKHHGRWACAGGQKRVHRYPCGQFCRLVKSLPPQHRRRSSPPCDIKKPWPTYYDQRPTGGLATMEAKTFNKFNKFQPACQAAIFRGHPYTPPYSWCGYTGLIRAKGCPESCPPHRNGKPRTYGMKNGRRFYPALKVISQDQRTVIPRKHRRRRWDVVQKLNPHMRPFTSARHCTKVKKRKKLCQVRHAKPWEETMAKEAPDLLKFNVRYGICEPIVIQF